MLASIGAFSAKSAARTAVFQKFWHVSSDIRRNGPGRLLETADAGHALMGLGANLLKSEETGPRPRPSKARRAGSGARQRRFSQNGAILRDAPGRKRRSLGAEGKFRR